ncbi:MAG: protein YgfX [Pseudomonadota bacterium]
MQKAIEIRLKRSRYYFYLLAFLLWASLVAVFLTRPEPVVLLLSIVWALCGAWFAYQRHFMLRGSSAIIAIRLGCSGWTVQTASGEWHEAILLGSRSTITAHLLCLTFKLIKPNQRFSMLYRPSVCLFDDSANSEDLRKLRVALLNSASEDIASRVENSIFRSWR